MVRRDTRASASGDVSPIPSFQIISPKKIAAGANATINPIVTTHIVRSFPQAAAEYHTAKGLPRKPRRSFTIVPPAPASSQVWVLHLDPVPWESVQQPADQKNES